MIRATPHFLFYTFVGLFYCHTLHAQEPNSTEARSNYLGATLNPAGPRVAYGLRQVSGDLPSPPVTPEQVQNEIDSLDNHEELSDELRSQALQSLKQALSLLKDESDAQNQIKAYKEQIDSAANTIDRIRAALATQVAPLTIRLKPSTPLTELESKITSVEQVVEQNEKHLAEIEAQIDGRIARIGAIAKETADIEERLEKTVSNDAVQSGKPFYDHIVQIERQSRIQKLKAQAELLQIEEKRIQALAEQWPLERDLAARDLSLSQKKLELWKKTAEQWRRDESSRYADAARKLADRSHPALRSLASRNAEIAELRVQVASAIENATSRLAELTKLSNELTAKFQSLESKVEHAPSATSTGILLRTHRDELPSISEYAAQSKELAAKTSKAHLLLMELKEERRDVAHPGEKTRQLVHAMRAQFAKYDPEQVARAIGLFVQTRRDLLDKLIVDQDKLLQELSELEVVNQDVSKQLGEFRVYLDERVLWVRSNELLSRKDIKQATSAAFELARPTRWTNTIRAIADETVRRPSVLAGVFAFLLLAFVFRQRLDRRLIEICRPPKNGQLIPFGRSIAGLAISIVLSASWPAVLLAIGYKLSTATSADQFTRGLGNSFFAAAILVWGCQIIREICNEDRVGHRMFGWPTHVLSSVRHTLELTVIVGGPMIGLLILANSISTPGSESLHRVSLIVILLFVAIQSYAVLRTRGSLIQTIRSQKPDSLVGRFSQPICIIGVGVPVALAAISVYGYHYSATQLSGRFAESLVGVIGLVVLHALALRWIRLKSHNRKIQFLQEQKRNTGDDNEDIRERMADEQEFKWQQEASTHILELLSYLVMLTLLVGGWFIWAEVLPALSILDHVVVWDNVMRVSEVVTDAFGKTSIEQIETNVPTTLKDVILATLIVVTTLVMGRRVTSLVEVTVLHRLPIDMGGRHAIAILLRYAATVTGVIFACHVVHLSWSSVQWLAAAMTVGLGFGLQEIFANLVSGLIILFERPIRAGDVVTIGDTIGTVTRMQMRATTITDFDRRELIVPNKRFITDNVINWTLSDPICRTIIPVGVAYGTNTELVESELLKVAAQSPLALKSPEPCVVFAGFGDSTLNFELRVFIAHRQSQPGVISALNMDIDRVFASAGIEIAFPQRDLHIRSVQSISPLLGVDQTTSNRKINKAA